MKHLPSVLTFVTLAVAASLAQAQITSQADAFSAGRAFAQPGSASAGGAVNATTGAANLPNFTTTAPESGNYGGGRGAVGAAGTAKQADCLTSTATTALAQQECDAVNFLSRNSTVRPRFTIDKAHDPLLTGSKSIIASPSGASGSAATQNCKVVTKTTPGTNTEQVCTEFPATENSTCQKYLSVVVTPTWICDTPTFSVNAPSGFDIGLSCPTPDSPYMSIYMGLSGGYQCHGDSCNSDYYPLTSGIGIGAPQTISKSPMARVYTGVLYGDLTATYDGGHTITLTSSSWSRYLPGKCPDGSTLPFSPYSFGFGGGGSMCTANILYGSCPAGMLSWWNQSCTVDTSYCPAGYAKSTSYDGDGNLITACSATPILSQIITFTGGPRGSHTEQDAWDNQCATYETKAQ